MTSPQKQIYQLANGKYAALVKTDHASWGSAHSTKYYSLPLTELSKYVSSVIKNNTHPWTSEEVNQIKEYLEKLKAVTQYFSYSSGGLVRKRIFDDDGLWALLAPKIEEHLLSIKKTPVSSPPVTGAAAKKKKSSSSRPPLSQKDISSPTLSKETKDKLISYALKKMIASQLLCLPEWSGTRASAFEIEKSVTSKLLDPVVQWPLAEINALYHDYDKVKKIFKKLALTYKDQSVSADQPLSHYSGYIKSVYRMIEKIESNEVKLYDPSSQTGLAETKAYAIFIKNGYLSSSGQETTLGGARMFESVAAAKRYLDQKGRSHIHYSQIKKGDIVAAKIVEVDVSVKGLADEQNNNNSNMSENLQAAISLATKAQMEKMLRDVDIDTIRQRLKELEAQGGEKLDLIENKESVNRKRKM